MVKNWKERKREKEKECVFILGPPSRRKTETFL